MVVLHQETDRIGEVVDIEELAARLPRSPDHHLGTPVERGFVKPSMRAGSTWDVSGSK